MSRRKDPAAVKLGRRGGRVSSPAKAAAARENGKRGGRPRFTEVADAAEAYQEAATLARGR
jgi:hypothetical protein